MASSPDERPDPVSACLDTTELLEAILLRLDSNSILRAQLVSHRFHAIINSNPAFKQRLFLLPADAAEIHEAGFRPNQHARPYILVEKLEHTDAVDGQLNDPQLKQAREDRCTQLAIVNPFLFNLPKWRGEKEWPAQLRFTGDLKLLRPSDVLPPYSGKPIALDPSPLRRMYLALPMPALVRFRIPQRSSGLFGGCIVRGRDEDLQPRTLGEMMEEVEGRCRFDEGFEWAYVKVQLYGRRVPESAKPGTQNSRKAKRLEKRGWRADGLNQKAVGRLRSRGVDESMEDVRRLFEDRVVG